MNASELTNPILWFTILYFKNVLFATDGYPSVCNILAICTVDSKTADKTFTVQFSTLLIKNLFLTVW